LNAKIRAVRERNRTKKVKEKGKKKKNEDGTSSLKGKKRGQRRQRLEHDDPGNKSWGWNDENWFISMQR